MNATRQLFFSKFSLLDISLFILIISSVGTIIQIWGGSWDVTSHVLREPESFFTPSHTLLYLGISLLVISAVVGLMLIKKQEIKNNTSLPGAFKLLFIGALMTFIAGPSDFLWHNAFGFDGLLSPSHITLVTGMLINSLAVFMGLYRLQRYIEHKQKQRLIQFFLIPSLSSLWYTSIWYTFMFALPFSESDFFNFNLDSYSATIIACVVLPLINSILFLSASKTLNNRFGSGFVIASLLIGINIFTGIIPAKDFLAPILPWYIVTNVGVFLLADIILNSHILKSYTLRYKKMIAGTLVGSIFYFLNYPMLTWTLGNLLGTDLVSINEVLPTFLNTIVPLSILTLLAGALMGFVGSLTFSRIEHWFDLKIYQNREKNVSLEENIG